ncbi:MAG: capsid protein [Scallop picorna-like virus 1]|nr:MAG: capsid protein [Scallop picorna-like virus 1]
MLGCISSANTNNENTSTSGLLTEFFDGTHPNDICAAPSIADESFAEGYTAGLTLGEWFSRPVKIRTLTWSANTLLGASFNPWYDYFNHPEIKVKLKGYSRLQANLHLKLVVNASPYHYGVGVMSYKPMAGAGLNGAGDFDFSAGTTSDKLIVDTAPYTGGDISASLIVKTSRPHAKFYAESSKGCEMQLPFCYYQNWVNLDTDLSELKQMGNINIYTPVVLKDSSGNGGNVVVTIYAWCDDHKVGGPSYVMQSGCDEYVVQAGDDEYQDRPVSTAMSVVSKAAGALSIIPVIKPYAMATSKVMAGASTLARWFGFSNPPVIKDVPALLPNYMPNFASPEISTQHDKLSLDPKNEGTVDPRTVGLDGVDHMAISHIVGRYVDYEVLDWNSTMAAETALLVQNVTPMVAVSTGYTGATTGLSAAAIQMTPSAQIGMAFQFWSGKITYKFTMVASQFHRGRLMVSYEPDGMLASYTSDAYTGPRTINKIWDVSTDPTFEFEVPWMAPIAMLRTMGTSGLAWYAGINSLTGGSNISWIANPSSLPVNAGYLDALYNGTITVSVLNPLTSNDPSYGASIICALNCAEVEYFSPLEMEYPFSMYELQSGDDLANPPDEEVVHAEAPDLVEGPTKHAIYVGEIVRSIRQLIHRTSFYGRFCTLTPEQTPNDHYLSIPTIGPSNAYANLNQYGGSIYLPNAPYVTGNLPVPTTSTYPNTGVLVKNGATTDADVVRNQNTKIMTPTAYFMSSYVGWRGSSCYTARANEARFNNNGMFTSLSISRVANSITTYFNNTSIWNPVVWFTTPVGGTTLPASNKYLGYQGIAYADACIRRLSTGLSGLAATNPRKVDVVNAIVPYYSNYRMLPANPVANYYTANKPEDLPWNKTSAPRFYAGTNEVIQCPRIDYDVAMFATPDIANLDVHPTLDVFHKAGVDFTMFWYLNPPTIHVYTLHEGGYPRAWY